jgi:hypothetical protein
MVAEGMQSEHNKRSPCNLQQTMTAWQCTPNAEQGVVCRQRIARIREWGPDLFGRARSVPKHARETVACRMNALCWSIALRG